MAQTGSRLAYRTMEILKTPATGVSAVLAELTMAGELQAAELAPDQLRAAEHCA